MQTFISSVQENCVPRLKGKDRDKVWLAGRDRDKVWLEGRDRDKVWLHLKWNDYNLCVSMNVTCLYMCLYTVHVCVHVSVHCNDHKLCVSLNVTCLYMCVHSPSRGERQRHVKIELAHTSWLGIQLAITTPSISTSSISASSDYYVTVTRSWPST